MVGASGSYSVSPSNATSWGISSRQGSLFSKVVYLTASYRLSYGILCYDYFMDSAASDFQKAIVERLQEFFSGQEFVTAVFLFGSAVGDYFSEHSDIDVAVLYRTDKLPTLDERIEAQDELSACLQRPVDLVVLNQVSPILGYQVLKYGKRLLVRDPSLVNAFFVRTLNEYFDLKQTRRVIEQSLQKTRVL
jgi:predicted nucleotidyltransferase